MLAHLKTYRIILGPQKHFLHLVCSVLSISTAIKTALKVAYYDFFDGPPAPLNGQLMEKVNHYNWTKKNRFFNGTKCKICFGNHRFNFRKRNGGLFFSAKLDTKGGSKGFVSDATKFTYLLFWISLKDAGILCQHSVHRFVLVRYYAGILSIQKSLLRCWHPMPA